MIGIAVLLLITSFFSLIIGIIKPTAFKIILKENATRKNTSLIFGVLTILSFVIIGVFSDDIPQSQQNVKNENIKASVITDEKKLSQEDSIKIIVGKILKGKNNFKKQFLKEVYISQNQSNQLEVFITFNADDNLNKKMIKVGIQNKMSELYFKLYKTKFNINRVTIDAYFPFIDKYGNESTDVIYESYLDKLEANKINWDADDTVIKDMILPEVWITTNISDVLPS